MAALESGNNISTLLPRDVLHWLPLLEDVSSSTAFRAKVEVMTTSMELNDEWHYVNMDATIKVCLKVLGHESYRAPKAVRMNNLGGFRCTHLHRMYGITC